MKRLTLVRHAAAEPERAGGKDFDRELSARGREEVSGAAARLLARPAPDLILASPARRALDTARLLAQALHCPEEHLHTDPRLYLAIPAGIRRVIEETDDAVAHLMLVGHNPGLSELASRLGDRRAAQLPTAGIFTVELHIHRWMDLG